MVCLHHLLSLFLVKRWWKRKGFLMKSDPSILGWVMFLQMWNSVWRWLSPIVNVPVTVPTASIVCPVADLAKAYDCSFGLLLRVGILFLNSSLISVRSCVDRCIYLHALNDDSIRYCVVLSSVAVWWWPVSWFWWHLPFRVSELLVLSLWGWTTLHVALRWSARTTILIKTSGTGFSSKL